MELRQLRQKAKRDCVGWLTHRQEDLAWRLPLFHVGMEG